jgi:hypothetical protein
MGLIGLGWQEQWHNLTPDKKRDGQQSDQNKSAAQPNDCSGQQVLKFRPAIAPPSWNW